MLMAFNLHSVKVEALSPIISDGRICIESWIFSFLVLAAYYYVDIPVGVFSTLWVLPALIVGQEMVNR